MPSLRVLSLDTVYNRLCGPARKAISAQLRQAAVDVLNEDPDGVEAFWWPPIDSESADNMLPYSVDVEYSVNTPTIVCERLASALLAVFDRSPDINPGEQYGVWIKTPHYWVWRDRKKE